MVTALDAVLVLLFGHLVVLGVSTRDKGSEQSLLFDLRKDEAIGLLLVRRWRMIRNIVRNRVEHDQIELARMLVAQLIFKDFAVLFVDLHGAVWD